MPEIKRSFAGGKMNKDLDERLVPNGEYRDAMNIQVRTTDGDSSGIGNAGTIQNIQGNKVIAKSYDDVFLNKYTKTVGSIANEKNNKAYFLISGGEQDNIENSNITDIITDNYDGDGNITSSNKKLLIDTIHETTIGASANTDAPVVVDNWGIYTTKTGVFGGFQSILPTSFFTNLQVSDFNECRVGMKMFAFNSSGNNIMKNAIIQRIHTDSSGNKFIYFYGKVPPPIWGDVQIIGFIAPRVLKFNSDQLITGINIIDDLLFWTDNTNEPKKINITRCKSGTETITSHTQLKLTEPTDSDVLLHYTDLSGTGESVNNFLEESLTPSINNDLKEEHITVIRKAPKIAPTLEMSDSKREGEIEVIGFTYDFLTNFPNLSQGTQISITDTTVFNAGVNWRVDDVLVWTEELDGGESIVTIKVSIDGYNGWGANTGEILMTVLSVSQSLQPMNTEIVGSGLWNIELEQDKPLFETKLVRFGCRYKYEDGEYSNYGPWSELAFLPDRFDYNYKKGYNLGMVNTVRDLKIKNFIPFQRSRHAEVVAVDVLYKTVESPNVYIVKTIKRGIDAEWDKFTPIVGGDDSYLDSPDVEINNFPRFGELTITSEMIHQAVDSKQLLRAWDNVPKQALAQEIAANRIMYGNYVHGYDITTNPGIVATVLHTTDADMENPKKSIKTIRNYKFGMVFGDKYGRETPVIANGYLTGDSVNSYEMIEGDIVLDKEFSSWRNRFQLTQKWDNNTTTGQGPHLEWMEYVKYYIKETTNEYYNLVMDRWYPAEDGNVWLSFVSADRNKIDEETYLILKNEHGSNTPVHQKARYKVIAIENDAPDFIKIDPRDMGMVSLQQSYDDIFAEGAVSPDPDTTVPFKLMTEKKITIAGNDWQGFLKDYKPKGDLKVRVVGKNQGVTLNGFKWRTVTQYTQDTVSDGDCIIRWNKTFGETADMLDRFQNSGAVVDGLEYFLEFREEVVKHEQPRFDGKFFVKVERDDVLESKVLKYTAEQVDYDNIAAYKLMYIDSQSINPANQAAQNTGKGRGGYGWLNGGGGASTVASNDVGDANNSDVNKVATTNNILGNWLAGVGTSPVLAGPTTSNYVNTAPFLAFGCDENVSSDDVPIPTATGIGVGDIIPGGISANAFKYVDNYDSGNDLVNWAYATHRFWRWIKSDCESRVQSRLFIDGARLRYGQLTGGQQTPGGNTDDPTLPARSYHYYKPTALDSGVQTSPAGQTDRMYSPTQQGELGRIFISTFNVEDWGFFANNVGDDSEQISAEWRFREHMTTPGNLFRFNADPNNEVYEIVGLSDRLNFNKGTTSGGGVWNEPCNHGQIGDHYLEGTMDDGQWVARCAFNYSGDTAGLGQIDDDDPQANDHRWTLYNNDGSTNPSVQGWQGNSGPTTATLTNIIIGGNPYTNESNPNPTADCRKCHPDQGDWQNTCRREGFRVEFRRVNQQTNELFADALGNPGALGVNTWSWDPRNEVCHDGREALLISLVGKNISGGDEVLPTINAACWETEPKEDVGLDLYYEASDAIPMVLDSENSSNFAPYGCKVSLLGFGLQDQSLSSTHSDHHLFYLGFSKGGLGDKVVVGIKSTCTGVSPLCTQDTVDMHTGVIGDSQIEFLIGQHIVFHHSDGTQTVSKIIKHVSNLSSAIDNVDEAIWENSSTSSSFPGGIPTGYFEIDKQVWKYPIKLGWHNCYSFGNGVESDRIRDDFNAPMIDNGVKVSTTFLDYGEERKGSGMIYSGIYNSISGVNNLNEFNMGEKITKDLNPVYGSIQAFKTRDTDVVVLTEDKVLKVTTNKDALFNADGNAQLTATNRVLGTAIPYSGDYGISTNPESLSSDAYRSYFTDTQRGAVLRLSRDGLTPISSVGMKTWFRENLKLADTLVGSFDIVNDEYNITVNYTDLATDNITVSFNETSKGWVSFKSFIPDSGVSVAGKYITALSNGMWEHHKDVVDEDSTSQTYGQVTNRNTFYDISGNFKESTVDVIFNEMPGSVKTFRTINYEGSKALIKQLTTDSSYTQPNDEVFVANDGEYYNLEPQDGWYINEIKTNLSSLGSVEFKEKEGKWFSRIDGSTRDVVGDEDLSEFSVQGLGQVSAIVDSSGSTITETVDDSGDDITVSVVDGDTEWWDDGAISGEETETVEIIDEEDVSDIETIVVPDEVTIGITGDGIDDDND